VWTLRAGFLNLWATEEILTGHGLVVSKLSTFCKLNLTIKNVGSSWATNVILRCISSLCVRNYCDVWPTWLCTICSYWRHFARQTQVAFVDMKTKSRSRLYVEEDVIFALSWIEPWISMLSNNKQAQLSHWFLAHITLLNIVLVVSISHPHVQQLLHRRSCMVGVPRSLCFFIN